MEGRVGYHFTGLIHGHPLERFHQGMDILWGKLHFDPSLQRFNHIGNGAVEFFGLG